MIKRTWGVETILLKNAVKGYKEIGPEREYEVKIVFLRSELLQQLLC